MTRELARLTTTTTALLTSSASSLADDRRVSPPTHSLTDQSAHGEYTRTTSTCTNTAPQSPLDRPYATHGGISQYNNVTLLASRPDSTSPRKPPDCIRPTAGHRSFLKFPRKQNDQIPHSTRFDWPFGMANMPVAFACTTSRRSPGCGCGSERDAPPPPSADCRASAPGRRTSSSSRSSRGSG